MNRPSPTTANCALAKPQVERLQYLEKCSHGRECRIRRSKPAEFCSGGPARVPPPASRDQNDPFSSARGDRLTEPATKSAYLLRLTRYPRPYPRFPENSRRSTCGFVFAFFGMVGGKGLNVVDGPFSWRAFLPNAQKRRHGGGRCLRGGWGVGVGRDLALPAARGLLAPGAVDVPSACGYPKPGLRRRPWR